MTKADPRASAPQVGGSRGGVVGTPPLRDITAPGRQAEAAPAFEAFAASFALVGGDGR
jgi:hypothetical protein